MFDGPTGDIRGRFPREPRQPSDDSSDRPEPQPEPARVCTWCRRTPDIRVNEQFQYIPVCRPNYQLWLCRVCIQQFYIHEQLTEGVSDADRNWLEFHLNQVARWLAAVVRDRHATEANAANQPEPEPRQQ